MTEQPTPQPDKPTEALEAAIKKRLEYTLDIDASGLAKAIVELPEIRSALTPAQDVGRAEEVLNKLLGKIRQKKGFYSVSVGHSETKQAHKTGILKGLDAAEKEIEEALAATYPHLFKGE